MPTLYPKLNDSFKYLKRWQRLAKSNRLKHSDTIIKIDYNLINFENKLYKLHHQAAKILLKMFAHYLLSSKSDSALTVEVRNISVSLFLIG